MVFIDIVHRDLKLENILLAPNPQNCNDNLYIKVIDFGLSIIKEGYHEMLHDRCGTLTYLSPEIITKASYSQQCDVWAMGVIMYLLLLGKYPFYALLEEDLAKLICYSEPDYSDIKATDAAIHLLQKMLSKNPAQRITAAEVRLHAWIEGSPFDESKNTNVLEMMKLWRSDMMLPQGTDCDWVSTKLERSLEQVGSTTNKDKQSQILHRNGKNKQSMKIPIHNIEFDRARKGKQKSQDEFKQKDALSKGTVSQLSHHSRQRSDNYGNKTDPSSKYKKTKQNSNSSKS